jgi:hypothetical protein
MPKTTAIEIIKEFCAFLQDYGVTEVTATYDGSGDSGDMDFSFNLVEHRPQIGNVEPQTNSSWRSQAAIKNIITNTVGGTICPVAFDNFIDAVWELLPGGWEINDGAYGEIRIDVREKTINVEHSERYTEVTTTEQTY